MGLWLGKKTLKASEPRSKKGSSRFWLKSTINSTRLIFLQIPEATRQRGREGPGSSTRRRIYNVGWWKEPAPAGSHGKFAQVSYMSGKEGDTATASKLLGSDSDLRVLLPAWSWAGWRVVVCRRGWLHRGLSCSDSGTDRLGGWCSRLLSQALQGTTPSVFSNSSSGRFVNEVGVRFGSSDEILRSNLVQDKQQRWQCKDIATIINMRILTSFSSFHLDPRPCKLAWVKAKLLPQEIAFLSWQQVLLIVALEHPRSHFEHLPLWMSFWCNGFCCCKREEERERFACGIEVAEASTFTVRPKPFHNRIVSRKLWRRERAEMDWIFYCSSLEFGRGCHRLWKKWFTYWKIKVAIWTAIVCVSSGVISTVPLSRTIILRITITACRYCEVAIRFVWNKAKKIGQNKKSTVYLLFDDKLKP